MPPPVIQQRPAVAGRHILSRNCRGIATRATVLKKAEKSKGNVNPVAASGVFPIPAGAENAKHREDFERLLDASITGLKKPKNATNVGYRK